MSPTVIVLAAGLGTRMKSGMSNALHPLAGQPLIAHVLEAVAGMETERVILVLGHQADLVRKAVEGYDVEVVMQEQQLGTGHAVRQAAAAIEQAKGPVMVLCADTPLLRPATLQMLAGSHAKKRAAVTVMTARVDDPTGYGRIVRGKSGVQRIVEEKDATPAQRRITEVNTGIYCFEASFLLAALGGITNRNAQNEYYLPDAVALARKQRRRVEAVLCGDAGETMGINSRADLSRAERTLQLRTNMRWMSDGVTMLDPETVFIGPDASVGRDTVLYPCVRIEGTTTVGEGCTVYPGTRIVDSALGDQVTVRDSCLIERSHIADGASIGPFAHLRPESVIGSGAKIGNFVEVKKSFIGEGSKANHLAYVGDATVGRDVNIGAGVITCNYDGFRKHQTVIGDGVFVGSDAQLVAPVRIGSGAVVAAGATITHDVPSDALAISRAPQENREGVAARRRKMKQKKDPGNK